MNNHKSEPPAFDFEAVFEPDDYLFVYEDVLTEERTERELEFLTKELKLENPLKILDLACGYGRHANRLAERGHDVTGLDITEGFLQIARRDAQERGVNVAYVHGDMRELSYTEEFDRAILIFTSFGYFEDHENFKVLENVARALKPGGLFFFDTFNRDVFLKHYLPYVVREKGDDLIIDICTFDCVDGRLYHKRILLRDGERREKPFFVRLYNPTEIKGLLTRAGLGIYKLYGGWDSQPFTSDSRRMIVIAEKKSNTG